MNKYIISIERYFSGEETEEIYAKDKIEAKAIAREYFGKFSGGNYNLDSVKVIKKLNTK